MLAVCLVTSAAGASAPIEPSPRGRELRGGDLLGFLEVEAEGDFAVGSERRHRLERDHDGNCGTDQTAIGEQAPAQRTSYEELQSFSAVLSINTVHNLDRAGCIAALREMERLAPRWLAGCKLRELSFEPTFQWLGPDWADINNPDTSMIGFEKGPGLSEEARALRAAQKALVELRDRLIRAFIAIGFLAVVAIPGWRVASSLVLP